MKTLTLVFILVPLLGQTKGDVIFSRKNPASSKSGNVRGEKNIARGGKAEQSSQYADYGPERAIDGNRENGWEDESCSSTTYENNPWWRLDLLKAFKIKNVTITINGDCCNEDIEKAEIRIGNSLDGNGNKNPRCAVITSLPVGATKTFNCKGMEGRYLNIVASGNHYLMLCEVEVTSQPADVPPNDINIARRGTATQSLQYRDFSPDKAIDGSRDNNVNRGSCSVTLACANPWWRLDLGKPHTINTVSVTIRDDKYYNDINGAEIRIGNSLQDNGNVNKRCAVISNPTQGSTKTYSCKGMEGRYINIVIPTRKITFLTLCEVEVTSLPTSTPTPPPDTDITNKGTATQSSQYRNFSPDKAIDGNNDGNVDHGSCSVTRANVKPWWRLDLRRTYEIKTVSVTIRDDRFYRQINGAEIRIGNSLKDKGNANKRCAVISMSTPGSTKTYVCKGLEGRYINIVIPTERRKTLTLCEVKVTGRPVTVSTPSPEVNIATGGRATQSSQYQDFSPDKAIDGNNDGNVNHGSCSTTRNDMNPWWRLDLIKEHKISYVKVTIPEDEFYNRISGAEIRIGNSLHNNGNDNPRCATMSNISPGSTNAYHCNGMEGQYINIVIPGQAQHLALCEVFVTGELLKTPPTAGINIASRGVATQSGQYLDASADKAIDGNSDSNWSHGSCSTTLNYINPWWRLDLLKPYKIDTVTVTIRENSYYTRIYGAEIRIGNCLDRNGNLNERCAVMLNPAPGSTNTYYCNGMVGRYINIINPGQKQYLTLCEVKVTGQPIENPGETEHCPENNIASRGVATQSSQYSDASADKAIDGNSDTDVNHGSCSMTQNYMNPWWRLDLLKTYKIVTVTVTVREDSNYRINGAEIHIGNSLNKNGNVNPRCATLRGLAPGSSSTMYCNGMEGRYINIVIPGKKQYLTLCEVKVTGSPTSEPSQPETNIAKKGVACQSSQIGNDSPDKAIDGNYDTNVHHGSCSITTNRSPWWRLDLLETHKVDSVTVTVSEDSHYSKISGAEIRIGNSLHQHGNVNPRCAVITDPVPGSTNNYDCKGMEGRYINIVIPGTSRVLTLCEVEVKGQPTKTIPKLEMDVIRGGIATQSSQYGTASANKAIDGNHDGNVNYGSCSITHYEFNPWWRLDLLRIYDVKAVIVTIRDDSYYSRIHGAEIRIGNSLENNGNLNPRCAVISKPLPGSTTTYVCNGMEGRYINIINIGKKQYLTLCEVKVIGQPSKKQPSTETNLANRGVATQSSQYSNGSPDKAIDGNSDSNVNYGSCSMTQNYMNPWWRLDLLDTYKIDTVTVTVREDSYYKRITGAEIRIGNSLDKNGNINPRCAVISNPVAGSTTTYFCKGMEGRYINIVIPGKKQYLTLCEVEVTGQPIKNPATPDANIAKGGVATQFGQYGNYDPDKAIDGNHDSDINHGSCSITQYCMNPWWRLDLLKTFKIQTVTVTVREDGSYKTIYGAEIRIGNSLDDNGNLNPRCAVISDVAPGSTNSYKCNGMEGRYLNVVIPGKKQYLTLCEVTVTGQPSEKPALSEINIAKGGIATQSSQYLTGSPDKAIDGNHDSNWNYGSCSSTMNYETPWWRLDLLKTHKINTVTVTIREDSSYKNIDGAEIRIGNSLQNNGNTNPRCAVISHPAPGSTIKYECRGMEGRYLNIVIQRQKQYLALCEVKVTGEPSQKADPTEKNIATGGTATQSSQDGTAHPKKAIDGNNDSEVKHGSCSTTKCEFNPWWRLDLLKTHKINTVTVTVRGDSYYKRIEGAEIHIGNSLDDNGNVNPRCAVITHAAPGRPHSYMCHEMEGRYINIVIPGKTQYLTLCEVNITGHPLEKPTAPEINIAKRGIATQSSQYGTASPDKAIDGNHDSNWNHGSCSTTLSHESPWWRLDLLKKHDIEKVIVTIREDSSYKRINGAEIRIGNSNHHNGNDNPRCAVISNPAPGSTNTYECKKMQGRFIYITIPRQNQYLTLCEVKVIGQLTKGSTVTDTNIARGGIATQSSQSDTASPDKAIDGNHDTNWKHGSCSTTLNYLSPWWRLDLLKTHKIDEVKVTIRADSSYKNIDGAEIRIGNSLNSNGNTNPRCAQISHPAPGSTNTYHCNGMKGRYVNIVIPGKKQYLTLCEVEVAGQPLDNPDVHETNVIKMGIATQSSQSGDASPDKAIDGNHDSDVSHDSCSTTLNHESPWWRLDLLKTHEIDKVTITIRQDSYYNRINGAVLLIGNSLNNNGNSNPRCAVISHPAPGSTNTYDCKGRVGRYINIMIPRQKQYLTLCEVKVTGRLSQKPAPIERNIAKGGIATQSSQYGTDAAEKAIDGNYDTKTSDGSCSVTQLSINPWWRLDLLKTHKIKTLTISITEHGSYKDMNGAEIRIGNSLDENGNINPRCAVITHPAPGTPMTFYCNEMEGRYVNIVIPGQKRFLTLCEVEITGEPVEKPRAADINIARGGIATQSSQYNTASADSAIDGNHNSNWKDGSCSTTLTTDRPWWRLDLLKIHKVNTVTVTIRDDSYYSRINGAEIHVGNSLHDNGNTNPRCHVISNPAPGSTNTYECKGMEGRYINIMIPGQKKTLTLCEVKVTGQPSEKPTTEKNIAKRKRTTQSSQDGNAHSNKAIDGNHDSEVKHGSCSTTKCEMNPWWRLDLLKTHKIKTVIVTVRGDSYHKRIEGAEIRIGNSLAHNGNVNPRCGVITHVAPGLPHTFMCHEMEGRYINIVIPGKTQYLTLCEVEVTGHPSDEPAPPEFNIAMGGIATQSSQSGTATPDKAIDGNHDSVWSHGSCSTTLNYENPWWRLDLLKTHNIDTVTVTIRQDSRYYNRINGAEIRIGNSLDNNGNNNPRCAVISHPAPGSTNTYKCKGMEGRYVNIMIPRQKQYLTLCEVKVTGQPSKKSAPTETNIAKGGVATQSSHYKYASPDKAIDGNKDTNLNHGSCSNTKCELDPWWRLDLLKTHKINTVTVTIRADSDYKRIEGAEIRIGNSLKDNGNVNPRCAIISHPAPASKNQYFCDGMEGRFINIVIPGKSQYLTLCEVEVTGQLSEKPAPAEINLAHGKKATQSSQYLKANADRAIDGNHDANWNHGSCSTTQNLLNPWWRLDLLKTHKINTVVVTIREDSHYTKINGAEIRIGDSLENNGNNNPRCAVISNPGPGSTNTYDCKGREGRYVNIVIPRKKEYLSLCEVKVTGQPSGKPAAAGTNIAEGGIATQSSQYGTASADKAIDGNHDSDWNHGSCSTTLNYMNPWWRLDLLKPYKINTVIVSIRADSYYSRINGAEIHIGNSLENNGNINPSCAVILHPAPGSEQTFICNGMEGRYINVYIPGHKQYLTLCEVKVTGEPAKNSSFAGM